MGAGQSRGKRNLNPKNTHAVQRNKSFRRNKSIRADAGYFLVKFKKRQVKIVNSESVEFRTIGAIVRRRVSVIREEWDRKLSFSMTVTEHSLETRAEMVADVLTALHQLGWAPMAPLGCSGDPPTSRHLQHHTAVCFKRRESGPGPCPPQQRSASSLSLSSIGAPGARDPCLCLQRFGDFLVFRGSQNTVLYSLVTGLGTENITGVSLGVASIICDYTAWMPPVLDNIPVTINDCQVLRLRETGAEMCEKVTSCLVREGYSPVLELDIAVTNALYFFIKDRPVAQRVRRLKSVKGRPGPGGGKPRVVSLRRKMVTRQLSSGGAGPGARTARPGPQKLAWWQQASTDSSEWETEADDN